MSYTKGTWKISPVFPYHVYGADQYLVAVAQGYESLPNAALIAAAPELLEVLKEMIEFYPAFRSRPVGAPNSGARRSQDRAIGA